MRYKTTAHIVSQKAQTDQYESSVFNIIALFTGHFIINLSCKKDNNADSSSGNNTVPAVYLKIYGATSITSNGTFITIKTNGSQQKRIRTLKNKLK